MVGSYLYSAFGQRVQKVAGGITTQLLYDRIGHLLEEANGSGAALRDYIWFDDVPVAMVDDTGASPVIYYIHTDQLGTPQKMTDGSANIVRDNVSDPFGNAIATQGMNWDAANWGSFNWAVSMLSLSNFRFPGQYFDSETGLNQNWNRDYDPTTGRYVQSDPVGLAAGLTPTPMLMETRPVQLIRLVLSQFPIRTASCSADRGRRIQKGGLGTS